MHSAVFSKPVMALGALPLLILLTPAAAAAAQAPHARIACAPPAAPARPPEPAVCATPPPRDPPWEPLLLSDLPPAALAPRAVAPKAAGAAAPSPGPVPAGSGLGSRLQGLERRVEQLADEPAGSDRDREPITVLRGEAIFGLETINNLQRVDGEASNGENYYIGYRLRLNIDTSFFGEDRLRIRLQARTLPELEAITGSPLTNISFDGDTFGVLEVADLWYRFPIGKRTELNITAVGGSLRDNVPVVNPLFYGSSRGSISVFGSEDPIIRSRSGAGIGLSTDLTRTLNLSVAAISGAAGDQEYGLLGSRNAAIAQLTYSPTKTFIGALAFIYSKNDGFLSDQFPDSETVIGNTLAAEVFYQISDAFAVGLRGGLINASARDLAGDPQKLIGSYALTIGFPDLFGKGNLLGFVLGHPPAVIDDRVDTIPDQNSAHLEMFYRYAVSDFLSITPGVMFVRSPDQFGGTEDYWIGALRMTFRF